MCGVLDVRAAMTPTLTLGYRQAVAVTDSVLARAGDVLRGDEFHRTAAVPAAGDQPAWQLGSGTLEGHAAGSVIASYLHTHWAGHPAAAARFTAACAKVPFRHEPPADRGRRRPGRPRTSHGQGRPGAPRGRRGPWSRCWPPPRIRGGAVPGRAETIIRAYVAADRIRRLEFALNDTGGVTPQRAAAWHAAAAAVADEFAAGAHHGRVRHSRRPEPLLDLQLPGPDRPASTSRT